MAASFEEKVEALRKLRDKQLAKQGKARKEDQGTFREEGEQEERQQEESRADEESVLVDKKADVGQQSHQPEHAASPQSSESKGASLQDADAFFCTGHCHERGLYGCEVDLEVAARLYRLAAEKGHTVAQWRLGELCESGLNGQRPKDAKEALRWYTLAAESGNAEAQNALALMLEDGADGVDQDPAAALRWHLAAAEKGNAVSQYCAACLLSRSGDVEAAHKWLQLSADQGFRPAEQVLEEAELMPRDLPSQDPAPDPDEPHGDDLVGLATRIAHQLKGLQDHEAEVLLEELLNECPSLVDAGGIAVPPGN